MYIMFEFGTLKRCIQRHYARNNNNDTFFTPPKKKQVPTPFA